MRSVPEATERIFGCAADVVGARAAGALFVQLAAELGGEHDAVPTAFQRLAEELLLCGRIVTVGGIEEVDSGLEGGIHDAGCGGRVNAPSELLQPRPTTETSSERSYASPCIPCFHLLLPILARKPRG